MAAPASGGPTRLATPLMAVRRPKAGLRRSGPRILMKMGDRAATQVPVSRPNRLAQARKERKERQTAREKRGGRTAVMVREVRLRGNSNLGDKSDAHDNFFKS